MMENIPKITFNQILKSPPVYMLIVAVSLLWFFVYQFTGASKQVNQNCEDENKHLRLENATIRKEKDDLTTALLVKNGIISEIKKQTDSAARKDFGNDAKKILDK
jgi:regulator of replication initiation timing